MFKNRASNCRSFFSMPTNCKAELETMFVEDLYGVQVNMGLVILAFQVMMMVSSLLRGGPFLSPRRATYFFLYALLFCLTLCFICILTYLHRKRPGSAAQQINLSFYYSILLCMWSCLLTLLDQHGGPNVSVFSYVLMAMAVFSVLRPWQSLVVFGGGFLLLNLLAYFQQGNPLFFSQPLNGYNLGMNSFFVTVLAIITSLTLYRYRIVNRRDRDLIQSQYNQISVINRQLDDMAKTDQLTGIGNRRCLNERMGQLAREQATQPRKAAGLMLDIDYFKQYNDNFGVALQASCENLTHNLQKKEAFKRLV